MDAVFNKTSAGVVTMFQKAGLESLSSQLDLNLDRFLTVDDSDGQAVFRLLQPLWDMRLGHEPRLESPLFLILVSLAAYFLAMIPWTFIDFVGKDWLWTQKYKIQPDKEVTWPGVRKALLLVSWNHVLFILPLSIAQCVWTPPTVLPQAAPEFWTFLWHQYASLVIFDFEYYLWHFIHHKVRFLYKHVHAVHHEYHATHVWVTQYLHPYELIMIGIFTTTAPWYFDSHPLTQWSFMVLSIFASIEGHLGYDLPFLPHHWAPFYGGVTKHDMHHQKPHCNYQQVFNWWDRLFGTECPGQMAGGYKPPGLLEWERREREAMIKRLAKKGIHYDNH